MRFLSDRSGNHQLTDQTDKAELETRCYLIIHWTFCSVNYKRRYSLSENHPAKSELLEIQNNKQSDKISKIKLASQITDLFEKRRGEAETNLCSHLTRNLNAHLERE